MKINIKHVKEKDLFELQIIEPQLRAHFLLSRTLLNRLRLLLEKTLIDSRKK